MNITSGPGSEKTWRTSWQGSPCRRRRSRRATSDYAFRIIAPKADVHAVLHFLGDHLDYGNFKARTDRTPGQERKPYHEVWEVLAKALGAYGRKPRTL